VANVFITQAGLSPQKVRRAILIAQELIGEERPLSTARFRTDGRTVFLQVAEEEGSARLIDLFRKQYAFREMIEPSLKDVDFDEGVPARWWPMGRAARIVLDPQRCFGRPIEADSAVPAAILAAAAEAERSETKAARVWGVGIGSIRRAVAFRTEAERRKAA
jgi:hypothetical protein